MSSQAMTESVYSLIGKGISSLLASVISCGIILTSKLRGFKKQLFCILGIEWTVRLHGVDD